MIRLPQCMCIDRICSRIRRHILSGCVLTIFIFEKGVSSKKVTMYSRSLMIETSWWTPLRFNCRVLSLPMTLYPPRVTTCDTHGECFDTHFERYCIWADWALQNLNASQFGRIVLLLVSPAQLLWAFTRSDTSMVGVPSSMSVDPSSSCPKSCPHQHIRHNLQTSALPFGVPTLGTYYWVVGKCLSRYFKKPKPLKILHLFTRVLLAQLQRFELFEINSVLSDCGNIAVTGGKK